jgi:CheY-like chemotaxis protein
METPKARLNVLVIDDDDVSSMMTAAMLESERMHVVTMGSPIGATRAISEHGIDVVLCDLNMPAMRGDAFARLFRKNRQFKHLPLIVISGASHGELEALMAEGTVDAVVHKSNAQRDLAQLIARLVGRART